MHVREGEKRPKNDPANRGYGRNWLSATAKNLTQSFKADDRQCCVFKKRVPRGFRKSGEKKRAGPLS